MKIIYKKKDSYFNTLLWTNHLSWNKNLKSLFLKSRSKRILGGFHIWNYSLWVTPCLGFSLCYAKCVIYFYWIFALIQTDACSLPVQTGACRQHRLLLVLKAGPKGNYIGATNQWIGESVQSPWVSLLSRVIVFSASNRYMRQYIGSAFLEATSLVMLHRLASAKTQDKHTK